MFWHMNVIKTGTSETKKCPHTKIKKYTDDFKLKIIEYNKSYYVKVDTSS
jgi:hypothetical protein